MELKTSLEPMAKIENNLTGKVNKHYSMPQVKDISKISDEGFKNLVCIYITDYMKLKLILIFYCHILKMLFYIYMHHFHGM